MNWQDYIAIGVVLLAAGAVVKLVVQPYFERKYGCGAGCGSCANTANVGTAPRQLLTIGNDSEPAEQPSQQR